MKIAVIALALMAGCSETVNKPEVAQVTSVAKDKARYLCVGMEYSARFGACPGCEKDARYLNGLMFSSYGYKGDMLLSTQATKAAVVSKLKEGIEATPEDGLFLFFYSGHGGQERIGGSEPSGADADDEYLCLYDTYMLDDEIWEIVSRCRGRVFLYFDACHSATMYRSVSSDAKIAEASARGTAIPLEAVDMKRTCGFTFSPKALSVAKAAGVDQNGSVRVLCWSGCREAEYSFGSNNGGELTLSLRSCWVRKASYSSLWEKIAKRVTSYQSKQHPVATSVGIQFDGEEAFK